MIDLFAFIICLALGLSIGLPLWIAAPLAAGVPVLRRVIYGEEGRHS